MPDLGSNSLLMSLKAKHTNGGHIQDFKFPNGRRVGYKLTSSTTLGHQPFKKKDPKDYMGALATVLSNSKDNFKTESISFLFLVQKRIFYIRLASQPPSCSEIEIAKKNETLKLDSKL